MLSVGRGDVPSEERSPPAGGDDMARAISLSRQQLAEEESRKLEEEEILRKVLQLSLTEK